jgi:hypothetical protein
MSSATPAKGKASSFIVLDLTKLTQEGLPLSGCPWQVATEGDPIGGTATGHPDELRFMVSSDCVDPENDMTLQDIFLGTCKCYMRSTGDWVLWTPPTLAGSPHLDFHNAITLGWASGWRQLKIVGDDFGTRWCHDGECWTAGASRKG